MRRTTNLSAEGLFVEELARAHACVTIGRARASVHCVCGTSPRDVWFLDDSGRSVLLASYSEGEKWNSVLGTETPHALFVQWKAWRFSSAWVCLCPCLPPLVNQDLLWHVDPPLPPLLYPDVDVHHFPWSWCQHSTPLHFLCHAAVYLLRYSWYHS